MVIHGGETHETWWFMMVQGNSLRLNAINIDLSHLNWHMVSIWGMVKIMVDHFTRECTLGVWKVHQALYMQEERLAILSAIP